MRANALKNRPDFGAFNGATAQPSDLSSIFLPKIGLASLPLITLGTPPSRSKLKLQTCPGSGPCWSDAIIFQFGRSFRGNRTEELLIRPLLHPNNSIQDAVGDIEMITT